MRKSGLTSAAIDRGGASSNNKQHDTVNGDRRRCIASQKNNVSKFGEAEHGLAMGPSGRQGWPAMCPSAGQPGCVDGRSRSIISVRYRPVADRHYGHGRF